MKDSKLAYKMKGTGNVLNFVEFQNVVTFFRILDALGWMLTELWKMILETVFVTERMQAVRTNVSLGIMICSVTNESKKTADEGVMKFVLFGQQQEIYVVEALITKFGSVYGN